MKPNALLLSALFLLTAAPPAQATIACTVVSGDGAAVALLAEPGAVADKIRDIPVGDLVVYPQEDLAPDKVAGWVWVQHDETQTAIWQTGAFGWLRAENIQDCG